MHECEVSGRIYVSQQVQAQCRRQNSVTHRRGSYLGVTDDTFYTYFFYVKNTHVTVRIVHVIEYSCDFIRTLPFLCTLNREYIILYIDTITGQVMIG